MQYAKKKPQSSAPTAATASLKPKQAVKVAAVQPPAQRNHTARDIWSLTTSPADLQKMWVQPALTAARLYSQDVERIDGHRSRLHGAIQDLQATLPPQLLAGTSSIQNVADHHDRPLRHPQTTADWVTVMHQQAQQAEGRFMGPRESMQFTALQRQVAQTLTQGYLRDRQPPLQRQQEYAQHVVALQRHPISGHVANVFLRGVPAGERPALQRAVDDLAKQEALQRQQEESLQTLHSLQRQQAELDVEATQPVYERIQARRGSGNPLPEAVQRHLEHGLNHDLSGVRIHDDSEADTLAKGVNATAFTTGKDIFFQSGKFNPNTQTGLELLAHEVTHTVQQSQGRVGQGIDPDSGLESEARQMGRKLATMKRNGSTVRARKHSPQTPLSSRRAIQRQAAPTSASPKVNQGKLLQLHRLLNEYQALLKAGQITPAEKAKVDQAVNRASAAIRAAEKAAGSGSSMLAAAGVAVTGAGGLAADDVTGIGVADDVAIPFVLLAAGALYLLGKSMQTSPGAQSNAWKAAGAAVDAAVATVSGTIAMSKKKRRSETRTDAPPTTIATTNTAKKEKEEVHRGRLQVQGADLSNFPKGELSWAWTRGTPPTAVESIAALETMKAQLSKRQLAVRNMAFNKAEARILAFAPQGGIAARWVKTFQNDNLPSDLKSARVDIEVLEGKAFV